MDVSLGNYTQNITARQKFPDGEQSGLLADDQIVHGAVLLFDDFDDFFIIGGDIGITLVHEIGIVGVICELCRRVDVIGQVIGLQGTHQTVDLLRILVAQNLVLNVLLDKRIGDVIVGRNGKGFHDDARAFGIGEAVGHCHQTACRDNDIILLSLVVLGIRQIAEVKFQIAQKQRVRCVRLKERVSCFEDLILLVVGLTADEGVRVFGQTDNIRDNIDNAVGEQIEGKAVLAARYRKLPCAEREHRAEGVVEHDAVAVTESCLAVTVQVGVKSLGILQHPSEGPGSRIDIVVRCAVILQRAEQFLIIKDTEMLMDRVGEIADGEVLLAVDRICRVCGFVVPVGIEVDIRQLCPVIDNLVGDQTGIVAGRPEADQIVGGAVAGEDSRAELADIIVMVDGRDVDAEQLLNLGVAAECGVVEYLAVLSLRFQIDVPRIGNVGDDIERCAAVVNAFVELCTDGFIG